MGRCKFSSWIGWWCGVGGVEGRGGEERGVEKRGVEQT